MYGNAGDAARCPRHIVSFPQVALRSFVSAVHSPHKEATEEDFRRAPGLVGRCVLDQRSCPGNQLTVLRRREMICPREVRLVEDLPGSCGLGWNVRVLSPEGAIVAVASDYSVEPFPPSVFFGLVRDDFRRRFGSHQGQDRDAM